MKKVEKIIKYRGGYILIRNEKHSFEYIIFYKGKFFSKEMEFTTGERYRDYSDKEFASAMEAIVYASKCEINNLKMSFLDKFLNKILHLKNASSQ